MLPVKLSREFRNLDGVKLRPAVAADIDAVLAFWKASAEDTNREDDRRAVERLLTRDPEALLLAVAGTEIIGSVIAGLGRLANPSVPRRRAGGLAPMRHLEGTDGTGRATLRRCRLAQS